MNINSMKQYYTTDLDGSGQIVAVADSGLDEDHGDFGTRIVGNVDVIGDGSTADAHSGHGTHVLVPFWVMVPVEIMQVSHRKQNCISKRWRMITTEISNGLASTIMLNTAYNNGARTHTNSWGSESEFRIGVYTLLLRGCR